MVPIAQTTISVFGASLSPGGTGAVSASAASGASNLPGLGSALSPLEAASAMSAPATPSPFGDLLVEAVSEVQNLQSQAKAAVEGLISGKSVDVHAVMIAEQKAGMGFELALSVRNKALAAYQQVMGMQF